MNPADHPTIQHLAGTDPEILHFFTPVEKAVIEVCKELVCDNIHR